MQRRALFLLLASALAGCATLMPGREPLKISLAGIEPLAGQGLELRMAVKLRVQNPNDTPIDYTGAALDLDVRGIAFASGVSDASGSVPRFGEVLLTVPVTASGIAMVRQALSLVNGDRSKLDFVARGLLASRGAAPERFTARGDFEWPGARPSTAPSTGP